MTLASADSASALSLTTTFAGGNSLDFNQATGIGNMFDLTTSTNDLTIKELAVNVDTTGTFILEVYTKSGTYAGFENNSSPWTLVSSTTGTGQGQNKASFVDITDFNLGANTLTGIYINTINATRIRYTNGDGTNQTYSNSDLTLNLGSGINGPFASNGISANRVWNGTVVYDIASAQAVPEPVTILGTLVALGMGTGMKRKLGKKTI
ncbi:PEP-CTERM sorting domain-containing protein [Geminocystis sp.]|uniref:PEP-CTERM sorting domain-containing protein n=1 Tax=Geminocystis sp. TaxID=2664100 RepID=UPI003593C4DF